MVVPISQGWRQWTIPWKGGTAEMTVVQVFPDRVAAVRVNGREVARFSQPTLKVPWAELELSGQPPVVKVVQIAYPHLRYRVLAFVDGMSLDDQRTESEWHADAPAAMDAFEADFASSMLFGRFGVWVLGGCMALPGVFGFLRYGDPVALVFAAAGFALMAAWWIVIIGLVRWLVCRRSWPATVRRMIVAFAAPGGVVAFVLLLAALTSSH